MRRTWTRAEQPGPLGDCLQVAHCGSRPAGIVIRHVCIGHTSQHGWDIWQSAAPPTCRISVGSGAKGVAFDRRHVTPLNGERRASETPQGG